jgi:hypothetical protein
VKPRNPLSTPSLRPNGRTNPRAPSRKCHVNTVFPATRRSLREEELLERGPMAVEVREIERAGRVQPDEKAAEDGQLVGRLPIEFVRYQSYFQLATRTSE